MLGDLLDPRIGSALYNLGSILIVLFVVAYGAHRPLLLTIAIISVAHIAFGRHLGYGLKYPVYFKDTRLQHVLWVRQ